MANHRRLLQIRVLGAIVPATVSIGSRRRGRRATSLAGVSLALALASVAAPAMASAAKPEFKGTTPVGFTSKATSAVQRWVTVGGTEVTCSGLTNTGTILNSKETSVKITLTGCKTSGFTCTTAGAASGSIVVNAKSYLVYANDKSGQVVSELLYPSTESFPPRQPGETPATIAEFTCAGFIKIVWRGAALASFNQAQLNQQRNTQTLTLSQTAGVQEPTTYETPGGVTRTAYLESSTAGGAFEQFALETTDLLTLNGGALIEITG